MDIVLVAMNYRDYYPEPAQGWPDGDLTYDGKVNTDDLYIFVQCYGCTSGANCWNQSWGVDHRGNLIFCRDADLDGSGDIDLMDIIVAIGNYTPYYYFIAQGMPNTVGWAANFLNLETRAGENGVYINIADTGLGSSALDVRTGGVSRLFVRGDGNIGIGTTTPSQKLDVVGGYIRSDTGFCIGSDCITSWGGVGGGGYWSQLGSSLYPTDITWNVGIGTISPNWRLTVVGGDEPLAVKKGDYYFFVGVNRGGGDYVDIGAYHSTLGWRNLILNRDGGNVGIGTTNPTQKLDVNGNVRIRSLNCTGFANGGKLTTDSSGNLTCADDVGGGGGITCADCDPRFVNVTGDTMTGSLTINTSGNDKILLRGTQADPHTIWLGDSKGIRFWDSVNGELMRITNDGKVGIGDPTPNAKLDVSGGDIYVDSGKGLRSETGDLIIDAHSTGRGTVYMYDDVSVSGNVGIGTTNPQAKLHIEGGGGEVVRIGSGGDLLFYTSDNSGRVGLYCDNDGELTVGYGGNLKVTHDLTVWNNLILTKNMDQIIFTAGNDDWWIMSKGAPTDNKAFAVYSPSGDGGSYSGWNFYVEEDGDVFVTGDLTVDGTAYVKPPYNYDVGEVAWTVPESSDANTYYNDPYLWTTLSVPRNSRLIIWASGALAYYDEDVPFLQNPDPHTWGYYRITVDGNPCYGSKRHHESPTYAGGGSSWGDHFETMCIYDVSAGYHTIRLQFADDDGGGARVKLGERTLFVIGF